MYFNWPEVCKVGREDDHTMRAIIFADPHNSVGKRIISAFPECFCEKPVKGPVPWSVIVEREQQTEGGFFPVSHHSVDSYIPTICFALNNEAASEWEKPLIPESINPDTKEGKVVEWDGKKFVVLENNQNEGVDLIYLAPAECIDPDL